MGASIRKLRLSGLTHIAHKTLLVIIATPYVCRPSWSHCYPEDPLGLGSLDEFATVLRSQLIWLYSGQMPNHLNPAVAVKAVLLDRSRSNG